MSVDLSPWPRSRFAAAVSGHPLAAAAAGEVIGQVLDAGIDQPSAAIVVMSGSHGEFAAEIVSTIHSTIRPDVLIGAGASGLLGQHREMPGLAGIALWVTTMPGITAFRIPVEPDPTGRLTVQPIPGRHAVDDAVPDALRPARHAFVLRTPSSSSPTAFRDAFAPTVDLIGGSVGLGSGRGLLVAQSTLHSGGAVGLLFPETAQASTLVSQACRPVGPPFVVTAADGTAILELGSQPAYDRFEAIVAALSPDDRNALRRRINLGVVVNESSDAPGLGDFRIHTVLGADRRRSAIVTDDRVSVGATVQFQVADPDGASDELDAVLRRSAGVSSSALVCACESRGEDYFGRPDHDAERFEDWTAGPWIGVFCHDVFGPVGTATTQSTLGVSALQFA